MFFFGLLTFFILQREKEIILNIHRQEARTTIGLIADDISFMMLSHNHAGIADNIRAFNKSDRLKVGVAGPDGSPVFGTDIPVPAQYLVSGQDQFISSEDYYMLYKPLPNSARCHSCHSAGDRTRGVVVIKSSLKGARQEVAATARRLIGYALLVGLVSEGFLLFVLRRYILSPVRSLSEGAALIEAGRLDHRIPVRSDDEIGQLAGCFNDMAESIKLSHDTLEEAVRQRTTELRVIAQLSTEVFRGDRSITAIIETFLDAITGPIGFGYAALCLIDKDTGLLSREFRKGIDLGFCSMELSLAGEHPFTRAIREARAVVRNAAEVGLPPEQEHVAIIPVLSHQRQRCREINLCPHEQCPAFRSEDDRCWLMPNTMCRSPRAVAGREKIYGCLHCDVFPVIGVLIAGRRDGMSESSLHSLEILGSEIASAVENHRLIEAKKQDIRKLIRLHDISVESLQMPDGTVSSSIASSVAAFANVDAAVLWTMGEDGMLHLSDSSGITDVGLPPSLHVDGSFIGKSIITDQPVETLRPADWPCLADIARRHGFLYAASVPLRFKETLFGCIVLFRRKDFLMTDSEKAVTLLFANQASAAMNTARLFAKLRAEKEFSDAIFNCTASGIMVLGTDGRLIKINSVGSEIMRLDPAGAEGRKMIEIYPELAPVMTFGLGMGREISVTCPDGSVIPLGFTNSPLFDSPEGEEGVIVLFRDLTEIKRLQAELRRREHFEAMGRVLSGVAHEIRNPLFGISSIGQILEREIETPQHRALIQAMLKETERMKRLVEELLLYTKPSRLDIRDIDLGLFFEELRPYISAKRNDLTLTLRIPSLLTIRADRDKITQVFLNILNNAIDAARRSITLTARKEGRSVEIEVSDDGPGIRDTDIQRVFEPFFTTKKGGTGLGLPICRKIVEDHGGSIGVFCPPDGGTTVVVSLEAGTD